MTQNKDFTYRKHVRIRLKDSTKAKISIINVLGSQVQSGEVAVEVQNMSPGGMQIATPLRFPVSNDFALQIKVSLGEWDFVLIGHLEWRRKEDNLFIYGCSYLPDQKTRLAIIRALNERLCQMSPSQVRIHDLYRRMTDMEHYRSRLDARG